MSAPAMPPMRSAREIQRAHDLLTGCLIDPAIARTLGEEFTQTLSHMSDVLCWALHHDHNDNFAELLLAVENNLLAKGIALVDCGRLVRPDEEDD